MAEHPHLVIPTTARPKRFTSPSSGPRERHCCYPNAGVPSMQNLIEKLNQLSPEAVARTEEQEGARAR